MGALQERQAEQALGALVQMVAPAARVWRDGQTFTLPARELVPGDMLLLFQGARVPADALILEAH